ncbi:hypothetical protein ACF1DV_33315 [Streptomyces achromogenes]|uniref:hypothetical protein n=1 Tax=Streptomyces achromogenes TaxID=67255 RepID=UPI0036FD1D0D
MPAPPHPGPAPTPPPGSRRPSDAPPARPAPLSHHPRPLVPYLRRALGLLAGLCLLGVLHQARPPAYGDRLTGSAHADRTWVPRVRGAVVAGYDTRVGAPRWRYARAGHRPVVVLPARAEAITLWDDGLLTATDGRTVRWHRALPDAAEWLPAHGGAGVLRPLGHGILAVVTPRRVAAYRTADGDLRWTLPARDGCAFRPGGALRRGPALLLAQPCPDTAWTGQLVALDDLGRITPGRTPLGSAPPAPRPGHRDAGNSLAPPR